MSLYHMHRTLDNCLGSPFEPFFASLSEEDDHDEKTQRSLPYRQVPAQTSLALVLEQMRRILSGGRSEFPSHWWKMGSKVDENW